MLRHQRANRRHQRANLAGNTEAQNLSPLSPFVFIEMLKLHSCSATLTLLPRKVGLFHYLFKFKLRITNMIFALFHIMVSY